MFKKKFLTILIFFLAFSFLLNFNNVFAYNLIDDGGAKNTAEKTGHTSSTWFGEGDLTTGIGVIIWTVLSLVGIFFLLLTMYGGYIWLAAQGNDQQVEKAKKIIINAVVGLAVVMAAYAISWFIVNAFGAQTLS